MSGDLAGSRFTGLGPVEHGAAEGLLEQLVPRVLPRLGRWARRTVEALPAPTARDQAPPAGYRDLVPESDGGYAWHYPRSNAAERIAAFLWLGQRLKDPSYSQLARRYADAMVNDPLRGIYRGDEEDGRGMVWYWLDCGLYMTNYTIRVPTAFMELARATGQSRYRDVAELSAGQLLRSQQATGIPREGWYPRRPPADVPAMPDREKDKWLSHVKINSRVGYITLALATMYDETGDAKYRDGLERFLEGFERYQNADGSFPQDIRTDRIEVYSATVKGHFLAYILNGVARAACLLPSVPALGRIAERLGDYLLNTYRQCGGLPYGNMTEENAPERLIWKSTRPDPIYGFAWLARLTGQPAYREAACRIALNALLSSFDCPDHPNFDGGIPIWPDPRHGKLPRFDGFSFFWTLLGLKAIEETR